MKRLLSLILGLAMLAASGLALANAKVFSMTGNAYVTTEQGAPARQLRLGDTVRKGDVVATAANSTLVLQFVDNHVVALTPMSIMHIEEYQYDEKAKSGGAFFNLLTGAMRTVTGLIGKSSPNKVAYKAGTATIGIRGTEGVIVTNGLGPEGEADPGDTEDQKAPGVSSLGGGAYRFLAFGGGSIDLGLSAVLYDTSGASRSDSSERVHLAVRAARGPIINALRSPLNIPTLQLRSDRSPQRTVAVTVSNGQMTFTLGNQTVTINQGQGVFQAPGRPLATPTSAAAVIAAIQARAADPLATPAERAAATAIVSALQTANSAAITNAVTNAVANPQQPGSTSSPPANQQIPVSSG